MPVEDIEYLTTHEIQAVYNRIVGKFMASDNPIRFAGLMFPDRIEAATERPKTEIGGHTLFPCVYSKAACYAHSIITTHPYRDGNKRAGMETAFAFLAKNGIIVEVGWQEYVQVALTIATHDWGIEELKSWLISHGRQYSDWFDAHLQRITRDGKFKEKRHPHRQSR